MKVNRKLFFHYRYWLLSFFIIGFLLFYLTPLSQEGVIVGGRGDTLAHTWWIQWFCENYWKFNFTNKMVYPPHGVNMAGGYDSPFVFSLTCLAPQTNGIEKLNLLAFMQLVLIFFSSLLVAKKYITHFGLQVALVFMYSLSPFVLGRLEHHINLLSLVWGFSLTFYLFEDIDLRSWRQVLWRFGVLGLILTSAWQNIPNLFLLCSILILNAWWRYRKQLMVVIGKTLAGVLIMTCVMLPFSLPMILAQASGADGAKMGLLYFTGVESYLLPWKNHIFYPYYPSGMRGRISAETIFGIDPMVWLMTLLLLGVALFRRELKIKRNWLLLLILYGLVPFAYSRNIGDFTLTIGDFRYLYDLLPFSLTRVPSRIAVGFVFMMLITSFVWLDHYLKVKKTTFFRYASTIIGVYAVLSVTLLARNIKVDFERTYVLVPLEAIEHIRSSTEREYILPVPLGTQGSDQLQNLVQLLTDKPLISGYISYTLSNQLESSWAKSDPILSKFNGNLPFSLNPVNIQLENANDFAPILAEAMRRNQTRWILAHYQEMPKNEWAYIRPFFEQLDTSAYFQKLGGNDQLDVFELSNEALIKPYYFVSYNREHLTPEGSGLKMLSTKANFYIVTTHSGKIEITMKALPRNATPTLHIGTSTIDEVKINHPQTITITQYVEKGINSVVLERRECQSEAEYQSCLDQLYFGQIRVAFE